jgi:hypothetical protein
VLATPAFRRAFAFPALLALGGIGTADAQAAPPGPPPPAIGASPAAAPSREPLLDDSAVIGLAKAEFDRLRAGHVDRALYTPEFSDELKDAQIRAAKHDELDPLGAPLKFTLTRTVASAGHRVYQYVVRCEHGTVIYTIAFFGPKNLEDGVYVVPIGASPAP